MVCFLYRTKIGNHAIGVYQKCKLDLNSIWTILLLNTFRSCGCFLHNVALFHSSFIFAALHPHNSTIIVIPQFLLASAKKFNDSTPASRTLLLD